MANTPSVQAARAAIHGRTVTCRTLSPLARISTCSALRRPNTLFSLPLVTSSPPEIDSVPPFDAPGLHTVRVNVPFPSGERSVPDRRQNLLGMAGDLDLRPYPDNASVGADQEGRPFDAHIGSAVHALFLPDAVAVADLGLHVGCKDDGKALLGRKPVVLCHGIGRYADHDGAF